MNEARLQRKDKSQVQSNAKHQQTSITAVHLGECQNPSQPQWQQPQQQQQHFLPRFSFLSLIFRHRVSEWAALIISHITDDVQTMLHSRWACLNSIMWVSPGAECLWHEQKKRHKNTVPRPPGPKPTRVSVHSPPAHVLGGFYPQLSIM